MWVNENPNLVKQLGEVVLDLGYRSGDITLRVSTFDNPSDIQANSVYKYVEEKTQVISSNEGQRIATPIFQGMRGKYVRVRIESEDGVFELNRAMIDVAYDEDPKTDDGPNIMAAVPSPGR